MSCSYFPLDNIDQFMNTILTGLMNAMNFRSIESMYSHSPLETVMERKLNSLRLSFSANKIHDRAISSEEKAETYVNSILDPYINKVLEEEYDVTDAVANRTDGILAPVSYNVHYFPGFTERLLNTIDKEKRIVSFSNYAIDKLYKKNIEISITELFSKTEYTRIEFPSSTVLLYKLSLALGGLLFINSHILDKSFIDLRYNASKITDIHKLGAVSLDILFKILTIPFGLNSVTSQHILSSLPIYQLLFTTSRRYCTNQSIIQSLAPRVSTETPLQFYSDNLIDKISYSIVANNLFNSFSFDMFTHKYSDGITTMLPKLLMQMFIYPSAYSSLDDTMMSRSTYRLAKEFSTLSHRKTNYAISILLFDMKKITNRYYSRTMRDIVTVLPVFTSFTLIPTEVIYLYNEIIYNPFVLSKFVDSSITDILSLLIINKRTKVEFLNLPYIGTGFRPDEFICRAIIQRNSNADSKINDSAKDIHNISKVIESRLSSIFKNTAKSKYDTQSINSLFIDDITKDLDRIRYEINFRMMNNFLIGTNNSILSLFEIDYRCILFKNPRDRNKTGSINSVLRSIKSYGICLNLATFYYSSCTEFMTRYSEISDVLYTEKNIVDYLNRVFQVFFSLENSEYVLDNIRDKGGFKTLSEYKFNYRFPDTLSYLTGLYECLSIEYTIPANNHKNRDNNKYFIFNRYDICDAGTIKLNMPSYLGIHIWHRNSFLNLCIELNIKSIMRTIGIGYDPYTAFNMYHIRHLLSNEFIGAANSLNFITLLISDLLNFNINYNRYNIYIRPLPMLLCAVFKPTIVDILTTLFTNTTIMTSYTDHCMRLSPSHVLIPF